MCSCSCSIAGAERHGHAIHTVALPSRTGPISKHMAQVTVAPCASDLQDSRQGQPRKLLTGAPQWSPTT